MKHGKHYGKLGRKPDHRQALLRNLATSLLQHGSIKTTVTKAKAVQPIADRMITLGKRALNGDANGLFLARKYLYVSLHEFATASMERQGGYTRVIKLGNRRGDNAPLAMIEYVDQPTTTLSLGAKQIIQEEAKRRLDGREVLVDGFGVRRALLRVKKEKRLEKVKQGLARQGLDWDAVVANEMQRLSTRLESLQV